MPLDFTTLAQANLSRCLRWHPNGGVQSWSLSDWGVAMAGECGEACNVIKKMNRLRDGLVGNEKFSDRTDPALRSQLADELADLVIYADLVAQAAGLDLAHSIASKFNAVSIRNGFPERL